MLIGNIKCSWFMIQMFILKFPSGIQFGMFFECYESVHNNIATEILTKNVVEWGQCVFCK
jgi:hypothetical protein